MDHRMALFQYFQINETPESTVEKLPFIPVALEHLIRLFRWFNANDLGTITAYINGPKSTHTILDSRIDENMAREILSIRDSNDDFTTVEVTRRFNEFWFGNNVYQYLHRSTVHRFLMDKAAYSRKKLQREHVLASPEGQLTYMLEVASFDVFRLKDIDEASFTPEQFYQRFGYAPRGRKAIKQQIRIGTRSFSVICMVGARAVECWHIEEGIIDSTIFANFVTTQARNWLEADSIGLVDNASIHRTDLALNALNLAFGGRYTLISPYSPHLKPVEKVFALVKQYIRENENEALQNPLLWINKAFGLYHFGGEREHVITPLWNDYFYNHQSFLNSA